MRYKAEHFIVWAGHNREAPGMVMNRDYLSDGTAS